MLCATDRLEETWTTLLASTQYFELDDDDRILNFTSKQVQEKLHQLHIGTVYARFSAAVKLKAADAASVTSVAHPPAVALAAKPLMVVTLVMCRKKVAQLPS